MSAGLSGKVIDAVRAAGRRIWSIGAALYANDAAGKASEMAFWVFLGLVPLSAIVGWFVAAVAGGDVRASPIGALIAVAPGPAARLVDQQLERLHAEGQTLAPLSAVGFIWLGSGGVHTAMRAIQISQTGKTRAWWLNRAWSVVVVLAFLLSVTGSTMALVLSTPTVQKLLSRMHWLQTGWLEVVRYGGVPFAMAVATVVAALFFAVSMFRPDPKVQKRVWPGAVLSGVTWVLVSWGFSIYASTFARFPVFYGSLAAVALFLLWLWLSCLILLVGAEVNLQIDGMRPLRFLMRLAWWRKLHPAEATQGPISNGR